ncbi:MAG: PorV/PorQ family protein [Elusimicrobia bacterium]|nr:PorV/PorQ family protein [Elusimicrobiota bacterium]
MTGKRRIAAAWALAALLGWQAPAFALGSRSKGTSGAAFLKIGPGARPAAMGEAFSAVEGDAHAVYYNPAGLAGVLGWDINGMHDQYFQGIDYDFLAAAVPLARLIGAPAGAADKGVLGLGVYSLSVGDIERRGSSDAGLPAGTFGANDMALAVSYGRRCDKKLSLGGTLKYIQQSLDDRHANAAAADLGALYRAGERWSLSGGLRHLGSSPKLGSVADPLPVTGFLGAAYRPKADALLTLDVGFPRDRAFTYGVGAELSHTLSGTARGALRLGYTERNTDVEGLGGLSMGVGLGLRTFEFDFAWIPLGELGNTFRYSLRVRY